ncbi:MAG: SlyX family protein, partial [Moraxella osloensis]
QKQSSDENGWVTMVEKLTQALIDLQTQVAFMEDTVDKLDNIVTEQSQLIADQQRQLQLLYQKLETQTQGSQIQPFDLLSDKPPHY